MNPICEQIVRTHKMPNHYGFELRDGRLSIFAAPPDRAGHKVFLANRIFLANVSNSEVLPRSHVMLNTSPINKAKGEPTDEREPE
jgi:hypothetical protein